MKLEKAYFVSGPQLVVTYTTKSSDEWFLQGMIFLNQSKNAH